MASVAELEYDDEAATWDYLTRRLGMSSETQARIGEGTTVPAGLLRARCRARFYDAMRQVAPHAVEGIFPDGIREIWGVHKGGPLPDCVFSHLVNWQHRFNLADQWCFYAALTTLRIYGDAGVYNGVSLLGGNWLDEVMIQLSFADMDCLRNPHDGKETEQQAEKRRELLHRHTLRWIPPHQLVNIPIFLDDLKHPDIDRDDGGYFEDEGDFGYFDPRTETIDDAVKRLMPDLEDRLRVALGKVAADDVSLNGAQAVIAFRSTTAFEWLVRYQVLGESKAAIARNIGKDRSHVTREINRAAELIELTLRDAKGGRPPKPVR